MNTSHTVHLSDGQSYIGLLVVYRDYISSNGKWRLFWENPEQPGTGVDESSTVTGKPHFQTMKQAVTFGIKRYGIKAKRKVF